jgi:hypothetical protein
MTKEEYIEGKKKAGLDLHLHQGVWWEKTKFGYCKPALNYHSTDKRPSFLNSLVGYNIRVDNPKKSVGTWSPFVMDEETLKNWSLETLKSGNRKRRIKKGLKNNEVKKIENIQEYKADFARILKSTAIRNGHGHDPEFYNLDNTVWWENILKVANYTEFWCSFHEGQMSAYICLHVMENIVIYDGVKSDTDLLHTCPVDAINHAILLYLKNLGNIDEVWYGGKSNRESLDSFKESYGFKVVQIPYSIRFFGGLFTFPKFIRRNVIDK